MGVNSRDARNAQADPLQERGIHQRRTVRPQRGDELLFIDPRLLSSMADEALREFQESETDEEDDENKSA